MTRLFFFACLFLTALTPTLMAQDYNEVYKNIDDLMRNGKYRTALKDATDLYARARADDDADDLLKALAYRATLTQELEEDGFDASLRLLHAALEENAERPVARSVIHYLIGSYYYTFAERNRYRLRNNTAVAGDSLPGPEVALSEWNATQLATAAEEYLLRSVNPALHSRARLSDLPGLIVDRQLSPDLNWTLLDLLASEAMTMLSRPQLTVTDVPPAAPDRLLISADNFVNLSFDGLDERSGTTRKLRLYQDLLRYHGGPKGNRDVRFVHDLNRLGYARQLGADPDNYAAALERLYAAYPNAKLRDLALVELATVYNQRSYEDDPDARIEALEILDRVKSEEASVLNAADNLRNAITQLELTSKVERQYGLTDHILISNEYRNLTRVYHRIVRLADDPTIEEYDNPLAIYKANPYRTASFNLPGEEDHFGHQTETYFAPLPAGRYVLLSSTGKNFDEEKDLLSQVPFQVSDLAVARLDSDRANVFQVHDFADGGAVAGAAVVVYAYQRRNRDPQRRDQIKTDAEGTFSRSRQDNTREAYLVRRGEDQFFAPSVYLNRRRDHQPEPDNYTALFSDRHLYRPGQTLHVYGLTYAKDRDNYPTLSPGQTRQLTLRDANSQEVATVSVTSDEYGRFNHDFRLPAAGLTGSFSVQTNNGSLRFRVEEYKRPKFAAELTAPDKAAVPGQETTVSGTAKLFSGPAVNDAQVQYRVFLQEVRYRWWGGGNDGEKELIKSGETTTDADGAFTITFTPDSLLAGTRKSYQIRVEADVTDATGETHAATVSFGLRRNKPVLSLNASESLIDRADTLTLQVGGESEGELRLDYRIVPVEKPDAAIRNRSWGFPDRPLLTAEAYEDKFPNRASRAAAPLGKWPVTPGPDLDGNLLVTDGEGEANVDVSRLPAGHYRIEWSYPDGTAGTPVALEIVDVDNAVLPAGRTHYLTGNLDSAQPGETLEMTLITAEAQPLVFTHWGSRKGVERGRSAVANKQTFSYTVTEADRGGIGFHTGFLRYGNDYEASLRVGVPWTNKELTVDYAVFRDKLRPGQPERWQLTVSHADGSPATAAALASMYDASLDAIAPGTSWGFNPFPAFGNYVDILDVLVDGVAYGRRQTNIYPRRKPVPALLPRFHPSFNVKYGLRSMAMPMAYSSALTEEREMNDTSVRREAARKSASPPPPPPAPEALQGRIAGLAVEADGTEGSQNERSSDNETPVAIRQNLQETAFWFPELRTNARGELVLEFDSPEALTTWNFRVLAHDKDLASVVSTQQVKTQKELMVLPNVPRFLRDGDEITLTARVNNMTAEEMDVMVDFEFFDPRTEEPLQLGVAAGAADGSEQATQTIGGSSGETFRRSIVIPDGLSENGMIGYRVIARAANFSDGEQNMIPVLTDRTLVTVTQPFYLKKDDTKTVVLPELRDRSGSPTLRHVGYTFQATTNPAWMALKSLPYLMEYPYDCTEQLTNRYFANQLAFTTVSRKPILEEVFRRWEADSMALKSELEQNADLKNALLTETPWVRAAQSESEQRARIAQLFDLKRLSEEQGAALTKLARRQRGDGAFSWFPGGPDNRYMTQYVLESFGRMRQLGVVTPDQEATFDGITAKAVPYLDQQLVEEYDRYQSRLEKNPDLAESYRTSSLTLHYLYARALAAKGESEPAKKIQTALRFYADLAVEHWVDYGLYEQALLASAAARSSYVDRSVATLIIESLRERAIRKDEFGMYWKYGRGFRWQNLPIETHCRILEAFRVAGGTEVELDDMRLWLLTNKRTNRWPTTKATAAAVFALLNVGTDWTTADGEAIKINYPELSKATTVALPSVPGTRDRAQMIPLRDLIDGAQNEPEAATGAFSYRVAGESVTPDFGTVRLKNKANDLVWGGVFWQYTELAAKVEASSDGPLSIERELFRRVPTAAGVRLEPLTEDDPLRPGERVAVKLTIRSDRDVDFVHVKDRRAATFEPVKQTSGYQRGNGLGYYFAPGDLATNFFLDDLPRGTHTLEYDLFVTYAGTFSNGLGRVQCMYAPEFSGVTAGSTLRVEAQQR